VFVEMSHQRNQQPLFSSSHSEIVVWDEEEIEDMRGIDQHGLLKKLALGADDSVCGDWVSDKHFQVPIQDLDVIWDREVAYELLGERHLSDVIWDREVAHEMNISELNVLEEHAIGNGTLYMQTISAVSAEVEENMQSKDVRVGMTATRSIDGIVMEHAVGAKSALNANHTASRTKLASHAQRANDVPVNFS
jgi:hypothetical protein